MDSFDAIVPAIQACQPWGLVFGTADVDQRDGALIITPTRIPGSFGGCDSDHEHPVPFSDGGIFVEVPAATPTGHSLAVLSLDSTQVHVFLSTFQGRLRLSTATDAITSLPYDPVAMRWWRLRPDRMMQTTVAEYSADGHHWSRLGEVDGRPENVIVELAAGVDPDAVSDGSEAVTRFDNLDVCPPR